MKTLKRETIEARANHALESARNDLSANILVRRAALHLSQADLAKQSGVSRPVISKLETGSGDFQISALARVAVVLDCPVAELLAPVRVGSVSDAEIVERFRTPRSQFVKGADLWAAIEEVAASRKTIAALDRRLSPGRRKRSDLPLVNGRKRKKD